MRRPRLISLAAWLFATGVVVLFSRTVAYALVPGPLAASLRQQAGGPAFPVIAVCSLLLGLGLSCAVVFVAALGVRERRLLELRPLVDEPRLRLRRLLLRAFCLFVAASSAFTLLESYLHWRAGMGWHGVHCLLGPVHRDALPLLAALSLVSAACLAAVEHVLAWLGRTIRRIRSRSRRLAPVLEPQFSVLVWRPARSLLGLPVGARAPPPIS